MRILTVVLSSPVFWSGVSMGESTIGTGHSHPGSAVPAGYRLVWADEFDGDGLPEDRAWSYDTEANRTGWYNNELQYYAAGRTENSRVADGVLSITARREALTTMPDYGGQAYRSARLITRGKQEWTYGFFEVRARLPCGEGTWPAIWMLGSGNEPYPTNGELDIMEQIGREPHAIHGTIHTLSTRGTSGIGASTVVPDACEAFHDYQMTWTSDAVVFAVDGVAYHTYRNPGTGHEAWPFDGPQYLLLNLAIGGDWPGPVDDGIFPVVFEVECVRVYQLDDR
jgi:beta-glucanase (GH16 family)